MSTPPPNPFAVHPNEDADHLAARQARADYATRAAAIRNDPMLSSFAKARALAEAHQQHTAANAAAYGRITARRQARLDYLASLVPSGPQIPEGTSPADRAVLLTAYRAAATALRDAPNRQARDQLLAEAAKYGDDIMQRAALTHAAEHGDTRTVDAWVEQTHGVRNFAAEAGQLRGAIEGNGPRAPFDFQDFHAEPAPKEVAQLPVLETRAGQGAA